MKAKDYLMKRGFYEIKLVFNETQGGFNEIIWNLSK